MISPRTCELALLVESQMRPRWLIQLVSTKHIILNSAKFSIQNAASATGKDPGRHVQDAVQFVLPYSQPHRTRYSSAGPLMACRTRPGARTRRKDHEPWWA